MGPRADTTGNLKFPECSTFAECIVSGTRQIRSLPSVPQKTLGKINTLGKQSSVLFLALGKDKCLPSVFFYTRQRSFCRVYYFWHSAKIMIRRVFFYTQQRIKLFPTFNLKIFSTLHIQHVLLHVKIWYIFIFVCYI